MDYPSDARSAPRREDHYVLEDLPANDRMLWGAVAYLFFPAALYRGRWDPFVRFHARQGVAVAALWVAAWWWVRFAWRLETEWAAFMGYGAVVLLICNGVYHALSLEFRGLWLIGGLADRLPYPKKLAEPGR